MAHISRRSLLGTIAGAAGAVSAAPAVRTFAGSRQPEDANGQRVIATHGPHQPGITAEFTAHERFLAFRLKPSTDRAALTRLFRILTADIEALTSGQPPIADTEPELAEIPARLSITVGFGPELVRRVSRSAVPEWLGDLPKFSRDALSGEHDGGDLLLLIASDDPTTVAHAARMLTKSTRSFAVVHWRQDGFRRAHGSEPSGRTMRNLMGQVDGTTNPFPDDEDFGGLVWLTDGWLAGGSALVLRRIRMEMDTWDRVDRIGREETIGRDLVVGAPLTGAQEFDEPDWNATNALGFHIISDVSHIRRARSTDPDERIYRRALNYDDGEEQGLLFACYQRDPLTQFVPIQQRLDQVDMLNEWVTHVGSAVFAIPPGWHKGSMLGETLLAL